MAWLQVARSERCVRLSRGAWVAALVWFALCLFGSVGWLGPGPAFLAWSAPALVIFALTIRWLSSAGVRPSVARIGVGLVIWGVLVAAAWDGGNRWVPEWSFPTFGLLFLGFPIALSWLMLRLTRRVDSIVAAV